MKTSNIISIVLTVVMVIECILMVITVAVFWEELSYTYTWARDENSFIYCMEDERYSDMVSGYYSNTLSGQKETEGLSQCYGVAKYFEAALWYNAYETVGNQEYSAIYKEKMEDAYEEMEDYQFIAEKIRAKLDME